MRATLFLLATAFLAAGCDLLSSVGPFQVTNPVPNRSRTLAELQYQEVLNNIAMLQARNLRGTATPPAQKHPGWCGLCPWRCPKAGGMMDECTHHPLPESGPLPPDAPVGEPVPLQLRYISLKNPPCPIGCSDEAMHPAPELPADRLCIMQCAYEKVIGFRFDMPTEHKLAAFFEPHPRLYAALRPGWYEVGTAREVPDAISYLGRFDDTYVWVFSTGVPALAELTFALNHVATVPPAGCPHP